MLYAYGFDRLGVLISDLYFIDPNPGASQEGAEQGVRLELRILERGELRGSIYSAQPIAVEKPIWRADLLESVDNPGSFDRAHHHPKFAGWEPGRRHFVKEMKADPIAWVGGKLDNLDGLLADAGVDPEEITDADRRGLKQAIPEIVDAIRKLAAEVRSRGLAQAPPGNLVAARDGWL